MKCMMIDAVIIYLKSLPALIVQFRHLLPDPSGNVGNGHMDDVLQEDGKVLQKGGSAQNKVHP